VNLTSATAKMWKSGALLKAIGEAAPSDCITEKRMAELTGFGEKAVADSCLLLRKRGLLVKTDRGCHKLTAAGRAANEEGVKLHSGPNGKHNGRYVRRNSLRERAWRAIRIKVKFAIDDLAMLAAEGGERDIKSNLGKYLRALARAGYVRQLPVRELPLSLSGPGCVRYVLLRDTGPKPPVWRLDSKEIWDQNLEQTFPMGEMQFASRKRPVPPCG